MLFTSDRTIVNGFRPDELLLLLSMRIYNITNTLLPQYRVRIAGENGVAHCVVSLLNLVENWEQRLEGYLTGGAIPDSQWPRLYGLMGEWASMLEDSKVRLAKLRGEGGFLGIHVGPKTVSQGFASSFCLSITIKRDEPNK